MHTYTHGVMVLIQSCKSKFGNIAKEHLFLKLANATVAIIIHPQGVQQCTLHIHNTPCTNYSYLYNKSHDTASRVDQSVKLACRLINRHSKRETAVTDHPVSYIVFSLK